MIIKNSSQFYNSNNGLERNGPNFKKQNTQRGKQITNSSHRRWGGLNICKPLGKRNGRTILALAWVMLVARATPTRLLPTAYTHTNRLKSNQIHRPPTPERTRGKQTVLTLRWVMLVARATPTRLLPTAYTQLNRFGSESENSFGLLVHFSKYSIRRWGPTAPAGTNPRRVHRGAL